MVRFVTTAYTHMYENSYVDLPGEEYRHKAPNELTDVGIRTERWRKEAGLKVADVVERANEMLVRDQRLSAKDYWAFVRGQRRITDVQIRSIAIVLGVSVHVMTHYSPGHVPGGINDAHPRQLKPIKISEPARRAEREKKAQGKPKPKPTPEPKPYDPDEAAKLLAKKFGGRIKRDNKTV